jgi:hypothetical protein
MSESHIVSAIKAKRDEIVRQITGLEVRLRALRSSLASLEAAGAILAPDHGEKFKRRRFRYFARNELSRLALDALRKAPEPMSLPGLARHVMKAKGLPAAAEMAVTEMLSAVLRNHVASERAIKTGAGPASRWSITPV